MRWRLLPALDSTAIKTLGLILYLPTVAWLFRVDGFLFRHVVPALEHGVPMTGGPYHRVRHPRHAGSDVGSNKLTSFQNLIYDPISTVSTGPSAFSRTPFPNNSIPTRSEERRVGK